MVKHFQQQQALNSCISSRKIVSFVAEPAEDRYSSAEVDDAGLPICGVSDDRIERLLKVMHSMNVARIDSVERFTDISKLMSADRNQTFAGPKRIASDVNIRNHQKECRETVAKSTYIRQNEASPQNEVSPLEVSKEISHHHVPRIDSCKQALALVASPSQSAVDSVKRLDEIARKRAVLRMSSVDGLTDDDAQSSSESTATDDTGSGTSSRRGSGDSLQQEPCRGYSAQRRHGRKDSLGTAVDFTRLIPTLVSDNEDFRQKEYQRTLSVQPLELQNSTW